MARGKRLVLAGVVYFIDNFTDHYVYMHDAYGIQLRVPRYEVEPFVNGF